MQHEDAEQVEDDVQDGGQQQEVERGLAVAQCSDETGEQVIKESERNADEDDQKIEVGTMQDVVRCLHHEQDSLASREVTTANTMEMMRETQRLLLRNAASRCMNVRRTLGPRECRNRNSSRCRIR